jgi:hypothetical protein
MSPTWMHDGELGAAPIRDINLPFQLEAQSVQRWRLRVFERGLLLHGRFGRRALGKPGRRCGLRVSGLHPHERI